MVDAGKKTVDAWSEIDEAMDTVTTKTGLTGEALLGLQEIAKGNRYILTIGYISRIC